MMCFFCGNFHFSRDCPARNLVSHPLIREILRYLSLDYLFPMNQPSMVVYFLARIEGETDLEGEVVRCSFDHSRLPECQIMIDNLLSRNPRLGKWFALWISDILFGTRSFHKEWDEIFEEYEEVLLTRLTTSELPYTFPSPRRFLIEKPGKSLIALEPVEEKVSFRLSSDMLSRLEKKTS